MVVTAQQARKGFTLTEIVASLVLLSIISVLGVLGARQVFDDTSDQLGEQAIQAVLVQQNNHAIRNGSFTADANKLGEIKGAVIVAGPSRTPGEVSVTVGRNGTLVVAGRSKGDRCLMFRVPALSVATGVEQLFPSDSTLCDASEGLGSELAAG